MLSFDISKKIFLLNGKEINISPEVRAWAKNHNWWTKVPLAHDFSVDSRLDPAPEFENLLLDKIDFKDKSVLILGCREGFFAFFAEARGAGNVVAVEDLPSTKAPQEQFRKLKEILQSKIEYQEIGSLNLNDFSPASFDIVIINDGICKAEAPAQYLSQAVRIAKDEALLISFAIINKDETPHCSYYCDWTREENSQAKWGPNISWFQSVANEQNISIIEGQVLGNERMLCLKLRAAAPRSQFKPLTFDEMPIDSEMTDSTAVLVMSCKKFEQLWDPFFILFKRYWPDCPYRVYFCTDHGRYPGVETIEVGEDKGWPANCRHALEKISANRVILFQEDFLLTNEVDTTAVRKFVRHTHDFNVACLRLMPCPGASDTWFAAQALGIIAPTDEYRLSLQLSIWDKQIFCKLLRDQESPWQLEILGSKRAAERAEPFLSTWSKNPPPVPYYVTAVVKGEWQEEALKLLDREGIPRAHIRKKL